MQDRCTVLWTSQDKEVAVNFVCMYAFNAKKNGWWQHMRVIVWGPSQKLLCQDVELQEKLAQMLQEGVHIMACRRCAENYNLVERLEALGIEVVYAGQPFTQLLKENERLVTV